MSGTYQTASPIQFGPLEAAARGFAAQAHGRLGQRRKYTGEPYITHPLAVAEINRTVPHDDAMLAASCLHDVIEDCGVTASEIESLFGADVAYLVIQQTKVSRPTDGNRSARAAIDRAHFAAGSARAQSIKVADVLHNVPSIVEHDPRFARTYLSEKRQLLAALTLADPTLIARARQLLELDHAT